MSAYHSSSAGQLRLLRLNISGRRFEIEKSVADKHANSLFGVLVSEISEDKRGWLKWRGIHPRSVEDASWIDEDEWYAQRPIAAFELVLDYLCTGRLHCPPSVCKEVVKRELAFWRLHNVPLAECCWDDEDEDVDWQRIVEEKERRENTDRINQNASRVCKYAAKIKEVMRNAVATRPTANDAARVFSAVSIFFILLAIINVAVSTLPELQTCTDPSVNESQLNSSNYGDHAEQPGRTKRRVLGLKYRENCEGSVIFEIVETVCIIWFTLEWIVRLWLSVNKCAFLKSPLNIVDALAVLPFYVDLLIWLVGNVSPHHTGVQHFLTILRVFRIFRLFNVVRLARYSDSLQLLSASLWQSRSEFGILVIFIIFLVTIFSSAVFYCEKDLHDTAFTSIPMTLWWGIVTITTTGYGDMVPESIPGKLLASVCCTIGLVVMAFPVSILVEHFHRLYRRRMKTRLPHRLAIMLTPNQVGVIRTGKLTRIANVDVGYTQETTKL